MDRLQAMEVFVAVVDHGGFAAAARRLDLSAPVVTRAVAELEARLGVRLLTRTTRTVRVTEAGARYADDCRRILADVAESDAATSGSRTQIKGLLSVTAPAMFGNLHVTPIVADYLRRHAEVDVQCLFVDRVVNLVDEGFDVAVRIGDLPDSSLQAVPVGHVRRVLVATPAYLAAHRRPATPAQLAAHVLIQPTGVSPYPEWRFAHAGRPVVQRIRPRLRITTYDAARTAALTGLGIARLVSYQVADDLASGALQLLLPDYETPAIPVHVLHREGRHVTQKVRAFFDVAATADGQLLVAGSTGYTQNPAGASVSEAAQPLLALLGPDGQLQQRLALAAGPRHNQLRALAARPDGRWLLGGMENGPGTHSADGNPALLTADGYLRERRL